MKLAALTATYEQAGDAWDIADQELKVEIADAGAGPYVVLSTERWAMNPEELDEFVAKVRALLAQVEASE